MGPATPGFGADPVVPGQAIIDADSAVLRQKTSRWQFPLSSNQPVYGGEQPGWYDPKKKVFSLHSTRGNRLRREGESRPQP